MVESGIELKSDNKPSQAKLDLDINPKCESSVSTPSSSSSSTFNYSLPSNCFPLVHQVAGHFYGKGRTKLG